VTVGETLTEARSRAGLSVEELSERTRIRGTVIRSIEEDNFDSLGGDLYVRGYVRAIAGAVGIDAQPLIREYDMGRPRSEPVNGPTGKHAAGVPRMPPPGPATTAFDLPAVTEAPAETPADAPAGDSGSADVGTTRFDLPAVSADPAATAYDLPLLPDVLPTAEFPAAVPQAAVPPAAVPPAAAQPPGTAETRFDLTAVPEDLMAVGYDLESAAPAEPESAAAVIPAAGSGPAVSSAPAVPPAAGPGDAAHVGRAPRKRRGLFIAAAAVVLVAAGAVGIALASGNTASKNTAATVVPQSASAAAKASAAAQASASAAAKASAAAQASASAAAQASQSAAAKAAAQRVVTLPVVSASAYGPNGSADGDDPGNAMDAIARDPAQPWTSQWYTTPTFGMLKHGTGLLLDFGKKVTVTSIRLDLAQYGGSDLQIRIGNGTGSQDLRVAATASNVGGTVKLTLRQPAAARYLLIWFTQLPPDGAGHYEASVSHAVVTGRR
jgi:hypothetical protein